MLNSMILHIVQDDKFIDMAYRAFERALPNANEFVIIGKKQPLKYIKETPIRFVGILELLTRKFAGTLKKYDFVVVHWLDEDKMRLVSQADKDVKFLWVGWGADYYDLICEYEKLLKPLTLGLFKELTGQRCGRIKRSIKALFFKKRNVRKIVNRINFFSPVLYEDYELIKKNDPDFTPIYIPWNYGSLEDDLLRGVENGFVSGNNILAGNSATFTNNHIDVFEHIKKLNLKDRKIICPLSYGDNDYKDHVVSRGKDMFSEDFIPLCEFMNMQDYLKILSSCSFAVMGHIRQQAGGNIVSMLHLGAKVFFYPESPMYRFFKKEDAFVYEIKDMERELNSQLNGGQIEHNRKILRKYWGRNASQCRTKELIKSVLKYKEAE